MSSDGKGRIENFHGVPCIVTDKLIIPFTGISFIEKSYGNYVTVRTNNKWTFRIELDEVKDGE